MNLQTEHVWAPAQGYPYRHPHRGAPTKIEPMPPKPSPPPFQLSAISHQVSGGQEPSGKGQALALQFFPIVNRQPYGFLLRICPLHTMAFVGLDVNVVPRSENP